MSWFADVAGWVASLFESHQDDDITFDFDESDIDDMIEAVVTSLDSGDVTTAAGAIDELNALAEDLGVDLSEVGAPDREALIELFWDEKEAQIAPAIDDLARELGVDIEALSDQDAAALQELWDEAQAIAPADALSESDFVAFLEENFPEIDPRDLDVAWDLFHGYDDESGEEIAAVFGSLEEAVAYCEGVPESILKIYAYSNYFIVVRDYKE